MSEPIHSDRRVLRLRVPEEHAGERLDRFLASRVPEASRTRIQAWIAAGAVRVDGGPPARSGVAVRPGSLIEVEPQATAPLRDAESARGELRTLYADEHLVVVDKPPGMLSHGAAGRSGATVSGLAVREYGPLPSAQGRDRPGIVHRLDAGTSGVLVLARTEAASASLLRQFRDRSVQKTYSAIVHNEPRFDSDWIEAAIARNPKARERRMVVPAGEGRAASTFYLVRERLRGFARLDCQPKTGRTHQLRVHLMHLGLPIVGDRVYKHRGPLRVPLAKSAPVPARQALHASRLELDHPHTGERVAFEAPLPPDIEALLAWLRVHHALA